MVSDLRTGCCVDAVDFVSVIMSIDCGNVSEVEDLRMGEEVRLNFERPKPFGDAPRRLS